MRAWHRLLAGALLLLLSPALACGTQAPAERGETGAGGAEAGATAPAWPAGTVLAVDGEPIRADEVDASAALIGHLYPHYAEPHRRRLALTNVFLPRAAALSAHPEAAHAARERAVARLRELEADDAAPSDALERRGDLRELGLELWASVRALEPGRWSAPLSLTGRWALVRVLAPPKGEPPNEILTFQTLEFPYLSGPNVASQLEVAIDSAHLVVVDPGWSRYVPETWKYRMRKSSS